MEQLACFGAGAAAVLLGFGAAWTLLCRRTIKSESRQHKATGHAAGKIAVQDDLQRQWNNLMNYSGEQQYEK